jgi:photosystem II stability/assembly factor-like uncharacterized protein
MKLYKIFLIFAIFLFTRDSFTQFLGWSERISGVTSRLNSVYVEYLNAGICGDSGVVLISGSGGLNWTRSAGLPSNINFESIYAYYASGTGTFLVAGDIGSITYVYRSTNTGSNWSVVFTQPNGHINSVWLDFTGKAFIQGNPVGGRWSLWKSTNSGLTFDSSGLYLSQSGSELGWSNSMYANLSGSKIWFGTNNSRIYYSSNYGANWNTQFTDTIINIYSIWFVGIDQRGFAGGSSMLVTSNGGSNWSAISTNGTGNVLGVSGQLSEWIKGYARGSIVYYSVYPTNSFPSSYNAPNGIYTHMGMPKSYNGGGQFICVRSNGGITRYGYDFVGINNISTQTPNHFSLSQNYPNPFNPVTNIVFDLPSSSFTRLTIYDMPGREIAVLVNEQLRAGTYKVDWNASNYPSGIYFYKITSGDNYTETKKMILIK